MFQTKVRKSLFTALASLAFSSALWAQAETGQIAGVVTDPSGAAVASASVTVKSLNTGSTRTTVTSGNGDYTITNLLPDRYEVTAGFSGFETVRQNFEVAVGAKVTADFKLNLGDSSNMV